MRITDRFNKALRAFNGNESIIQQPDYTRPEVIENIKVASLPPSLQQYASFIITPPPFYTFWSYFQAFSEIQTPVNRVASRVSALGGRLYNENGEVDDEKTAQLYKEYNLKELIEEFVTDILVYGQATSALFNEENSEAIQMIPAHQVTLWQTQKFNISRLTWQFEYTTIDIEEDFSIVRIPSINSKFFGKSPLTSLYDDLNQMSLDRTNFNRFLQNNSFFGVAVIPRENINRDEFDSLVNSVHELNNPQSRYKAGVYAHTQDIKVIKQEIQARLSTEEKEYIAVKACNAVGYPYQFLKKSSGGLGQGEQKTTLQTYKEETIDPLQDKAEYWVNNFVLQLPSTKEKYAGFTWKPNEMMTSTLEDMAKMANTLFASGLISGYEAKTRFMGYTDDEVQDDDKFRKIGTQIVKEGELKEGNSQSDEIQDDVDQNIKSIITVESIKDFIANAKTLNGNDKQRIKKFLTKVKAERDDGFSPVPIIIENDRAKMLEEMIKKAMIDQFKDFDFIINKKAVNADTEMTEEEIREELAPLAAFLDVPLMTYYISYLMTLGKIDAINQIEELGLELSDIQRAEINTEIQNYANKRVETLLGSENGGTGNLDNPLLPSSLDDTTVKLLLSILSMATTRKEAEELFTRRLADRVKMIRETEAARAYNAALDIVTKKKEELGWQWLRTRSADPREIHLVLVGRTARNGQSIDGEYPGVRINCKCGAKLIKL